MLKRFTKDRRAGFKRKLLLGVAASVAALCLALAGCAFSDTITQKIYDNKPDNAIDTEAQKVLNNTIDAEKTSDQLPKLTTDNTDKEKQDTDQDLPSYGGDTSDALVSQPVKAKKKTTKEIGESEKAEETPTEADGNPNDDKEDKSKKADKGKSGKKNKGNDPENPSEERDPAGKGKNKDNEVKAYENYGEYPEIPKNIKHVAAVGDAATIVSMLGGTEKKTPLVYADEEFLDDKQVQKVLKARGISKTKTLWKNDGTSSGDLSKKKLEELLYSKVELCFVTEGDTTLTKKQRKKLIKANIIVYYLPDMTTASNILSAVDIVGQILEAGGNDDAGDRAASYKSFHKELTNYCKDANGGITGGYNYDKSEATSTNADDLYTLVINDWDATARYKDPNGYLSSKQGVAVSDLGYEEAPYAYYLSVGGVINNASAGAVWQSQSGYSAVVWQFTTSKAPVRWKYWSKVDRGKVTKELDSQGEANALMWSDDAGAGVGTEEFPGVVVAAQDIKAKLEKDAKRDNGLYHPYSFASKSSGGVVTYSSVGFYTGKNLVEAFAGTHGQGTESVLNDGTGDVKMYDVYVNPAGLFSSWLDGSVESVLESAWAYKTFRDGDYDLNGKIEEFYSDFYGYDLTGSDLKKILAGPEEVDD